MLDLDSIKSKAELLQKARWLEGKTLSEVDRKIKGSDRVSPVHSKGNVGYVVEHGFFGITKNSINEPDIKRLGVEIKTCPLKYTTKRTKLAVKEPLSLNIINYNKEVHCKTILDSSLYKKNKCILFIAYIQDPEESRSRYKIKYVFLWKMDKRVISELEPDYDIIIKKIRAGKAHKIHQSDNAHLTLCPKHGSRDKTTTQPCGKTPAEIRAFRLKVSYMNRIFGRALHKEVGTGGWKA